MQNISLLGQGLNYLHLNCLFSYVWMLSDSLLSSGRGIDLRPLLSSFPLFFDPHLWKCPFSSTLDLQRLNLSQWMLSDPSKSRHNVFEASRLRSYLCWHCFVTHFAKVNCEDVLDSYCCGRDALFKFLKIQLVQAECFSQLWLVSCHSDHLGNSWMLPL